MPLGARFAVKVFQQQQKGKKIFINIKKHVLDTLDASKDDELTPKQSLYKNTLPKNGNNIYVLSPRFAGALVREFIQEHYEEILTILSSARPRVGAANKSGHCPPKKKRS